jgi:hypothetical protein
VVQCDDVTRHVQGSCRWTDGSGRCVRLTDTSLLTLSEVERRALQQAALARLQQINLGTTIKIPEGIPIGLFNRNVQLVVLLCNVSLHPLSTKSLSHHGEDMLRFHLVEWVRKRRYLYFLKVVKMDPQGCTVDLAKVLSISIVKN